jgi:hypothetical protein
MFRLMAIVFTASLSLMGCGIDVPSDPPEMHSSAKNADALADGGGSDGEVGTDSGGDSTQGTDAADSVTTGSDTADGGDEIGEVGGDEGETLDDILKTCGDIDFDQPTKVILDEPLTGLPIVNRGKKPIFGGIGIDYTINILGALHIVSSVEESTSTTSFQITAQPALAQAQAETEVNKRAGTTTTKFVPKADRSTLIDKDQAWEGIVCTVQPGFQITSTLGGGTVITSFDPPLPASVSPKADLSRYDAELKTARTWTGIKATVTQSTNPDIPNGTIATGTVTVSPIDPVVNVTLDDKSVVTIKADLAFEVRADFGTPAMTNNLGVKPVTKFYIDNQRRLYKSVIAEVQDGVAPPATFVVQ